MVALYGEKGTIAPSCEVMLGILPARMPSDAKPLKALYPGIMSQNTTPSFTSSVSQIFHCSNENLPNIISERYFKYIQLHPIRMC